MNFTSLIFMKYYIILHLQGIANGPAALFTSSASFKNGVPGMEIPGNHLKIQISKCPSEKSLCFVVLIYWKHLILIYSSDVRNIFLLHMSVLRSNRVQKMEKSRGGYTISSHSPFLVAEGDPSVNQPVL